MIPYKLSFSPKAESEFLKLPKEMQERINKKLDNALIDPFRYFIRLQDYKDYKLRVGDYRVLVDINPLSRTIEILKIGHRKNIYKNL